MAQQPMLMASGSAAMWHGAVFRCTARAVGDPPRPPGPMPVAFTASSSSRSNAAASSLCAGEPTSRSSAVFASAATLSNVPPTPTPISSGGQAFAAFSRTQARSSALMPSRPADGGSITRREALSDPPPFSITCMRQPAPGTMRTSVNAGLLLWVFARSKSASFTMLMRRRPST